MADRYVEKSFLYLLVLSLLFHLAVFLFISRMPQDEFKGVQEPTMVDLTEIPDLPKETKPQLPEPKIKRHSEKPQRVAKEMAPRSKGEIDRIAPPPRSAHRMSRPAPGPVARRPEPPSQPDRSPAPVTRGEGILKPRTAPSVDRPKLFPSATRLARLEEAYREKYRSEVEDGETRFLNTDDIQFGSFLRRLETAIYGVWHYPQAALLRGIEGTTPVRITFSRKGEIVRVDLLETSGSKILDDEVLRSLNQLGPIGSFPKGYSGEQFKLIAFFHYGNGGGRLH
ncbi:MAG TPA: TonB-dependent receptor [Geobacter sp.]|nr:TonB-dependent receptor [Geobacter sp.]